MAWYWWILIAAFIELILCAFLIRFFRFVHECDEDIEKMKGPE